MGGSKVNEVDFTVFGEPASAKNQRRIVKIKGSTRLIKSAKALSYAKSFLLQCPQLSSLITGDVSLLIDVHYASRRPDLACVDLIQDLLQDRIIENDRQVKASQSLWNLDRQNPRVRVRVKKLEVASSVGLSLFKQSEIWGGENSQAASSNQEAGD